MNGVEVWHNRAGLKASCFNLCDMSSRNRHKYVGAQPTKRTTDCNKRMNIPKRAYRCDDNALFQSGPLFVFMLNT